jgi:hypothetical protein
LQRKRQSRAATARRSRRASAAAGGHFRRFAVMSATVFRAGSSLGGGRIGELIQKPQGGERILRLSPTRAVATVFVAAAFVSTACTRPPQGGHQGHTLFSPNGQAPAGAEGDSVTLDPAAIDADAAELEFDLPGGAVKATRDQVVRRGARDFTWFGRTPGRAGANVSVTVRGDDVSAAVDTDDGSIVAANTSGRGVGLRTRLDPGALNEESDPVAVPAAADVAATTLAPGAESEITIQATPVIDVLIVYNSAVLSRYGSASAVNTVAQRMIDKANKSFVDSVIGLQYRLVNVSQVPDAEIAPRGSYFYRDNISNLSRSANSTSARVGQLRNQFGADLVQAWGNFSNVCGQGYQPSVTQNLGAAYGISVINNLRSCTEGQAVSHELGHNLGGGHDRITSNRPSGGGDAYGMVDRANRFLTIMGYPQNCGSTCVQTWTFSNPAISYNGHPTGIAGSIDNARVMNIVGPRVAANKAPTF